VNLHISAALRRPDLAVDLGTAVTRVASAAGVVATPSEIGHYRPLRGGVVVDRVAAAQLLRPLIHHAQGSGLGRPRVVLCIPTGASGEERAAAVDAVRRAGASQVAVVAEPLAAAIGAGLDLGSPFAQMIVDIGHGVTDAAVIRSGTILLATGQRVACSDLENAAIRHIRERHGLVLSCYAAERLLRRLWFDPEPRGIGNAVTAGISDRGDEGTCETELAPLAEALRPVHERIVGVVDGLLRRLSDEVGAELVESGMALTGGGALVPGLAASISRRTRLDVRVVADPLGAVIQGARRMLPTVARLDLWE
jgi:rod shape-determining protein MreB